MKKKNIWYSIPLTIDHQQTLSRIRSSTAPVLVAFSGGKDSVAMVLYLLQQGIPAFRIHLHHHEVDGRGMNLFDWPCTTSYCRSFAKTFGLRILFSYRKGGIYRSMYRNKEPKQDIYYQIEQDGPFFCISSDKKAINTRLKFPAVTVSLITRWCSAEAKIDVLRSVIVHHPAYQKELFVLTGERREESANRFRYPEIEYHHTHTLKRTVLSWRPIIDWTETEVWDIIKQYKVQPHPAYMLGWSRCSCQLCIFSSPATWSMINEISPEKVARIRETEKDLGFTIYNKKTIDEIMVPQRSGNPVNPFWRDQGMGSFTAPMIVDEWILPCGAFEKERTGSP